MEMEMLVPPGPSVSPRGSEETWRGPDETPGIAARGAPPGLEKEQRSAPPSHHTPFLPSPGVTLPGEQLHNDRRSENCIKYSTESFLNNINFPSSGKNG